MNEIRKTNQVDNLDQKIEMNLIFFNELPFIGNLNELIEELPDLSHIQNKRIQKEIELLIRNYKPKKIKESPIKLQLTLTDDIPVYQRARRLPIPGKEIVEKQIKEWLRDGVIRLL